MKEDNRNCLLVQSRSDSDMYEITTFCLPEMRKKNILYDTSNVTDKFFPIFSKLFKIFKRKLQGSAKIIWGGLRSKFIRVNDCY